MELAQLVAGLTGIGNHLCDEVIGIHHRSLTALHLAVGELHHSVGEVDKVLAPLEAQTVEQDGEHLEVIVLLIAHHVDHLVDGIVTETKLGRTDVLRHVDRSSVGTKQ